jgi:hypothetical protein
MDDQVSGAWRMRTYMFILGSVGSLDIAKGRVILDDARGDQVVQLYSN